MAAITVFFTFLLLLAILAAGAWGGYELHRRTSFLEAEYRRIRLASVEDTQEFQKQIEALKSRLESHESRTAEATQRPAQSVNYTQRSQMLRMIRRGDEASQIANSLGVPLNQIRLLMKLPGVAAPREKAQSA